MSLDKYDSIFNVVVILSSVQMSMLIFNAVSGYALAYASNIIAQKKAGRPLDLYVANVYALVGCVLLVIYMIMLLFIRDMPILKQVTIEVVFFAFIGNYIFVHLYDILIEGWEGYNHSVTMKKYIPSVIIYIKMWPLFNYLKVAYLPRKYRIIVGSVVAFFYNIYMSEVVA